MANPLAALKSFAATKRGKVVLGGTAAGGVVVAGLVTRRRAGGDPTAPGADTTSAPPYAVAPATGTSGTNTDAFPTINSPGIDVGQFEQLLSDLGRLADASEEKLTTPEPAPFKLAPAPAPKPAPAPAPKPPAPAPAPQPTIYTVVSGDNLTRIAARYGLASWRPLYDANRAVIGGNPNLIRPGQRLVIPGR